MSLVPIYILLLMFATQVFFPTTFILDISDIFIETIILADGHTTES